MIGAVAVAAMLVAGGPAGAQTPETTAAPPPTTAPAAPATGVAASEAVAAAVAVDGWYADPVLQPPPDRNLLDGTAGTLRTFDEPIGFALLAAEPAGSSTAFAESVLDRLAGHGGFGIRTVVVVSPDDIGVVSDVWSDDAIDRALDTSLDDVRADPLAGIASLAGALDDQPTMDEEGVDDGGGGTGTAPILLGAGAVVVAGALVRRFGGGGGAGDALDDDGADRYRRRSRIRTRSFRSRSSSGSRRRSSSGGSRRGRGGRRL